MRSSFRPCRFPLFSVAFRGSVERRTSELIIVIALGSLTLLTFCNEWALVPTALSPAKQLCTRARAYPKEPILWDGKLRHGRGCSRSQGPSRAAPGAQTSGFLIQ